MASNENTPVYVVRPTFARNVEGIKGGAVAFGAISVSADAETRRALRVPPARQLRAQSHAAVGSCASQIVVVAIGKWCLGATSPTARSLSAPEGGCGACEITNRP